MRNCSEFAIVDFIQDWSIPTPTTYYLLPNKFVGTWTTWVYEKVVTLTYMPLLTIFKLVAKVINWLQVHKITPPGMCEYVLCIK